MTMKTTMKTMMTTANPNIYPSVYRVRLEEEYDPYLEQRRSRKTQDRVHSEWKDEGQLQRRLVFDSEP
jgi:hypothetical protein